MSEPDPESRATTAPPPPCLDALHVPIRGPRCSELDGHRSRVSELMELRQSRPRRNYLQELDGLLSLWSRIPVRMIPKEVRTDGMCALVPVDETTPVKRLVEWTHLHRAALWRSLGWQEFLERAWLRENQLRRTSLNRLKARAAVAKLLLAPSPVGQLDRLHDLEIERIAVFLECRKERKPLPEYGSDRNAVDRAMARRLWGEEFSRSNEWKAASRGMKHRGGFWDQPPLWIRCADHRVGQKTLERRPVPRFDAELLRQ